MHTRAHAHACLYAHGTHIRTHFNSLHRRVQIRKRGDANVGWSVRYVTGVGARIDLCAQTSAGQEMERGCYVHDSSRKFLKTQKSLSVCVCTHKYYLGT